MLCFSLQIDLLYPGNESLRCNSVIDYFLTFNLNDTVAFNILDLDINLSDHRPIMAVCDYCDNTCKLVAWHSGRTSVSGRRTFPVLRATCS